MTHNTHITALIAAMLASTALSAEPFGTGMTPLEIRDTEGTRHLDGFVWYPTGAHEATERAHGNAVWEAIRVAPYAEPVDGTYPLVVLSHGMYGNSRNQAWLAEQLVADGFIVAAIDHPGTSTFQRDPDHAREMWERPRDITRTIDHLLDASDLAPLIDDARIYMAGHSLGGFTAVALAGGRFDADGFDAFCDSAPDDLACGILDRWNVAKTPEDRVTIAQDLSDDRISAIAVFDLGGAQTFSADSLGAVRTPMLVYGAPVANSGLDLDVESRALVAALPADLTTYVEPATLAHFDFLGQCTENGLAILKDEEPDDAFVCDNGRAARAAHHAKIAEQVSAFFNAN
ncbi:alpha/beta fold hydrolase [Marivita sp. S6314]|uniref:alpha/beta hydrolase family protein n=1 Tax=Marivita sp. S6314 TaxID=2926406 RepID=UPI001FF5B3DB|nr:alpha/beta fold hydrolase [Marivita sp. S6314]MCK0148998.1 alpha/beta fold hydrolase [Marivita sp. S6314]